MFLEVMFFNPVEQNSFESFAFFVLARKIPKLSMIDERNFSCIFDKILHQSLKIQSINPPEIMTVY